MARSGTERGRTGGASPILPPAPPGRYARKRRGGGTTAIPRLKRPAGQAIAPRRRSWPWRLLRWGLILAIWGLLAAGGTLAWFARDLPRPETALDAARRPGLTLTDRQGRIFASYGDLVGEPLRLSDLPRCLPAAAVSVEDRRFWNHYGLDPIGIARAVWINLSRGRLTQGGSTITQQVAKNLFLTNARTFSRKVQELMLTVWLERTFSKQEILEIWLNRVYLGSGTWGVDAAARTYFGISARRLNLWQCAMLAGIPRAPSRFNPRTDPAAALARTKEVLAAMVETGAARRQDADAAAAAIDTTAARPPAAGWFADWAAERSADQVPTGADAVLHTTLDSRLQAVAEARLASMLDGPGTTAGVGQGAIIVMDAGTGAVRAMVGGRNFRSSPFNRAVLARRQPGSAFKPIIYLTALEHGFRPDGTVLDAPLRLGAWQPQNFDNTFHGEVTLEAALAESLNTATVRLLLQSGGPRAAIATARRLGLVDRMPDDATVALGTGEASLLQLSTATAILVNGGLKVAPAAIESIESEGRTRPGLRTARERVVDPDLAAMMVRMLGAVVRTGSGRAAAIAGRSVIGKTGTTQDSRDAWFVGAVGGTVIGVWLGNDDASPMRGVTGGGLPARLFREVAAEVR